jgi:DNA repair protein RadA/Sms
MAKSKVNTAYVCDSCGEDQPKWMGQCPVCKAWSTIKEVRNVATQPVHAARIGVPRGRAKAIPISEVSLDQTARMTVGISEFDRVLGGGIVPGSLVLIGGDPGIGKSTLMLQAMDRIACQGATTLYVSGEESAAQTRMRAERLGVGSERLLLLAEQDLNQVLAEADRVRPAVMIIDSIQTVYCPELDSAPGNAGQLREVTARLMLWAKRSGVACMLVGHVTKEGSVAGPRTLEHMVDTVLYFEGEGGGLHRILRAHKNRFGSTDEIGLFAMTGTGMEGVANPSAVFLEQRPEAAAGSAVCAAIQGTRPILLEVQALVAQNGFGAPRRTALGIDRNRLGLLAAVLERRVGLMLSDQDLYVSVAGGARLTEPAGDLALCAAMVSSFRNQALPPELICFGEVGLAGELRPVVGTEQRLKEAVKLGFTRAVIAEGGGVEPPAGLTVLAAKTLSDALDNVFEGG